jgi:hypothetical protein
MRAIIMAGGTDEKWTARGGSGRRHFQLVAGERVIDRIVRQLRERGVTDIWIVCPDEPEYVIEGTKRIPPTYPEWGHEALNGIAHWSDTERTLQVYGDTIFTDAAMDTIIGFEQRTFQMFGRFGNSGIKKGGGELFAMSFWPEQRGEWVAAVRESFRLRDAGIIRRAGSWEGYRIMGGAHGPIVQAHRLYPAVFTNIRDITDDFDDPRQYQMLRALFESRAA